MGSTTRSRLVEAASGLFPTRGFEATSLAQVCNVAGANPGSLYHFFPTKADLLRAVLDAHTHWLEGELAVITSRTGDPVQRIFSLLDAYRVRLLESGFTNGCPIGRIVLELGELPAGVREAVEAHFDRWLRAVRSFLATSHQPLPEVVDLGELATFILTTMEGGVLLARARRSIDPFDHSVGQLWDYVELLAQGVGDGAGTRACGRGG